MPGSSDADAAGDVAARRTLLLLAVAVIVVLFAAALLAIAEHRRDHAGRRATDVLPDAAVGARPTDIGPPVNTEIAAYIGQRGEALASATGTRLAVVSLARYATEAEARRAIAPVTEVALVVAAPGGMPSVVRGSLGDWAKRQRAQARTDFDDVHALVCSKSVDDPDFTTFYATEEQRLLVLQSADGGSAVVFGLVVKAPAGDLRELAKAPGIRLVDVGGNATFDADAAYRALRPEEVNVAGHPTAYRSFIGQRAAPRC